MRKLNGILKYNVNALICNKNFWKKFELRTKIPV